MTTKVTLDVELIDGEMFLMIRGSNKQQSNEARVPLSAAFARYLSSRLLGAAAVVDPAGHQAVLDGITALVAFGDETPTTH